MVSIEYTAPLVAILRWISLISAGLFVGLLSWRFLRRQRAQGPNAVLSAICLLALLAILGHQAVWQLAGFRDDRFVGFMSRYSPRVAGAKGSIQRGRIVDRNGIVLAETEAGKRRYPQGAAAAHVTGYVDARYGKTGTERADDDHLRGASLTADASGLRNFARNLVNHRLVTGHDTVLTIDARLQAEAYRLLGNDRGAIVGISPHDGAILVLASTPSYDPHDIEAALAATAGTPLVNRAITGLYPPGSTFKTLVASVASEHKMGGALDCPPEGVKATPGVSAIRDHEYYEHERDGKRWRGHGKIGIEEALARSSNVYFAQLGLLMGPSRMNEIADRFKLREPITIFRGASGTIASKTSRVPALTKGQRPATAQLAIGQGALVVTPLHMASAIAAIANGGDLRRPYLNARSTPGAAAPAISPRAAELVGRFMRSGVLHGTSRGARIPGLPLAGKTGTAQTPSGDDHGWFVAFGPMERPALALAVIVENSGYGSRRAVPIARSLFEAAAQLGLLEPTPETERPHDDS